MGHELRDAGLGQRQTAGENTQAQATGHLRTERLCCRGMVQERLDLGFDLSGLVTHSYVVVEHLTALVSGEVFDVYHYLLLPQPSVLVLLEQEPRVLVDVAARGQHDPGALADRREDVLHPLSAHSWVSCSWCRTAPNASSTQKNWLGSCGFQ